MIYIFNGDEVEEHATLPLNPQYPPDTWAVTPSLKWYFIKQGDILSWWIPATVTKAPAKHRLQLLILGPPK